MHSSGSFFDTPPPLFTNKILTISPIFNDEMKQLPQAIMRDSFYKTIPPIHTSKDFVTHLRNRYNSKIFSHTDATISNLKKHGQDYNIIHLDSHTFLDPKDLFDKSFIAFAQEISSESILSNGQLSINDICLLEISPKLLILGSCNTGQGADQVGEGIMSINYNFNMAGINNIIYSNWSIEETATHNLLKLFYKNLEQTNYVDFALQEAKIEYLQNHSDWKNGHNSAPHFWAGLSFNGIPSKAKLDTTNSCFVFILLFPIILFLFYLLMRKVNLDLFRNSKSS